MTERSEPILIATIPGPLPPVPEYLIRRRPGDEDLVEPQSFAEAVKKGDAGLVGMDGSGNEYDFPRQLGSIVVDVEVIE